MYHVLAGAFLISFASVFVKTAHVGPTVAVFYRFLFGFLALGIAAAWRREPIHRGWTSWIWAAVGGAVFSLDLFFWHRSIHYIGPGLATIIANFQVFSLAAIGALFMSERIGWRLALAIPLAFLGLLLIVGWNWSDLGADYRWGVLYGLITAAIYTALTLILRKSQTIPGRLSPMANMTWVCLIGAMVALPVIGYSDETFSIPDLSSWAALIAYGTLCSGLGWSLITTGLPKVEASRAGLILILQPTLAFVWDILLFARPTTALHVLGAGITLVAIYLGSVRSK
jgi:drug/metabolite transporter (DMT)-like permease